MTAMAPICVFCKHFREPEFEQPWSCNAYPKGIPDRILGSLTDHRKPARGDHGIQFEAVDAAAEKHAAAIIEAVQGDEPEYVEPVAEDAGGRAKIDV